MDNVRASVIVPNWNGKHLLKDCLESLQKQSFRDFEIILVDNNSTDDSVNYVTSKFPIVRIIKLEKNFGFAKAINEGVKKSNAKYVVLLNNDTKADKDWLGNLIKTADNHPEVISINSKILDFYNKRKINGVGIQINEVGQARSIGWNEKDEGQFEKDELIFGATGGASLFRRETFIKLDMFDENYFMYFEEVDFAFRAQMQGYKSLYCPKAIVFHKHKATAGKFPEKVEYWQFRNMTQTIIKDFPSSLILKDLRLLKIILVHLNTIFYQFRKGFFWAPILADLWILIHLPNLISQRNKIQKTKKVNDEYINGFLLKKKITFWNLLK